MPDSDNKTPRAGWLALMIIRVLAPVAAGLAGYLYNQGSAGGVAGCDGFSGFDCSAALDSRWATWLGVPVSLIGAVCYAGVAVSAWLVGRRSLAVDAAGWRVLELLTPAILGAAAWFLGLQAMGLAPACLFCLAVHACGLVIAAGVLLARWRAGRAADNRPVATFAPASHAPKQTGALPPPTLGLPTLGGITTVAALVLVQLMLPPKMKVIADAGLDREFSFGAQAEEERTIEEPGADAFSDLVDSSAVESPDATNSAQPTTSRPRRRRNGSRTISFLSGRLKIDTYKYPILGSPEAETVILELMNYGCPACRKFAPLLDEARKKYGDQVAVVVLPVPNELLCNKYVKRANDHARGTCKIAQLAVAVAEVEPEEFERVHHYLLDGESMPNFISASLYAKETVNPERLSGMLIGDQPKQKVNEFIELFAALARSQRIKLPSQIIGDKLLIGPPATVEELCDAWERHTTLRPVAGN